MTTREEFEQILTDEWPNSAVIEWRGQVGIVFVVGEVLSATWRSGKIIVFWADGEHTILPDEFEVLAIDVFDERWWKK